MRTATAVLGPMGGYVAGFSTLVEFVFTPPAIALAIGAYLNIPFPALEARTAAVGAYFVFTALNVAGVTIAATFELVVTILAIGELVIFMAVVSGGFAWSHFTVHGWAGAEHPSFAMLGGRFAQFHLRSGFFSRSKAPRWRPKKPKIRSGRSRARIFGILTLVALAFGTMISAGAIGDWPRLANIMIPCRRR